MENSFASIIESSRSILILLPQKPTFDKVAAGLGLYLSLLSSKEVSISCSSPMVVEFNRLVGIDRISPEVGNKILKIKFLNYEATAIERVSADIEDGEFSLTVIPKPGNPSPKKEQVDLYYSGISGGTMILIGGASERDFPALKNKGAEEAQIVHIGTKSLSLSENVNILSFAQPSSSHSEIIATLIKESGLHLDPDIATNLVMGIEEGTMQFSRPEVTADTFEIFANLLRSGGRRFPKASQEETKFPPGAIPSEPFHSKKQQNPKAWLEPKIFKGTSVS